MRHIRRGVHVAIACVVFHATDVRGQANVPQFRGDYGLLAGTLPPPGAALGFFYTNYRADQVSGMNGMAFPNIQPVINVAAAAASFTFPQPILGGHWAISAIVPWSTVVPETVNLDTQANWAISDAYVQPIKLGWSLPDADIVAGFGMFMPTGRYHAGALDNNGLGMWSYEGSAGTTVYLGPTRRGSISTLVSYQAQSRIEDTDKRPGRLLTLEGGAGYSILKEVGQIGLVYYAQWKVTDDEGFELPPAFDARSRVFGLGPEVTVPFPLLPLSGVVTLRYYMEMGNRVAPEGDLLYVMFTMYWPGRKT